MFTARRMITALTALLLALGGVVATATTSAAATIRVVGSATCQSDGTYLLTAEPNPGTVFEPSVTPVVREALGGTSIFTVTTAYTPAITANQVTMTVPGDVQGTYRITMGYVDAVGILNVAVVDTVVAGTCKAPTPIDVPAPDVRVICGADNDEVLLPTDPEGATYSQSGWVDGKNVVAATPKDGYVLNGQTEWTFTDEATACEPVGRPATAVAPVLTVVCGADNDTVELVEARGVLYTETGWINGSKVVTATAKEGYHLVGQSVWTLTDSATRCAVEVATVAPVATAVCGADDDTVSLPTVEGVTYSQTGWVDGKNTVTALAQDGYTLGGDTSWTFTDSATACSIVADTGTDEQTVKNDDLQTAKVAANATSSELAHTGFDPSIIAAGLLLIVAGALITRQASQR